MEHASLKPTLHIFMQEIFVYVAGEEQSWSNEERLIKSTSKPLQPSCVYIYIAGARAVGAPHVGGRLHGPPYPPDRISDAAISSPLVSFLLLSVCRRRMLR